MQSVSLRNAVVVTFAMSCNVGRIYAEERLLAGAGGYQEYARQVRWRLLPGVW